MFLKTLILTCLLLPFVYGDITTSGTEFFVVLPWNNGVPDSDDTVFVSIFCRENRFQKPYVTIKYPVFVFDTSDFNITYESKTVNLNCKTENKINFDEKSVYTFLKEDLNSYPDFRIWITATVSVQVMVNSFNKEGAGDSFTVIPISMADNQYSLSLPDTSQYGFSMLYFLPLSNTLIEFTVVTNTVTKKFSIEANGTYPSNATVFGGPKEAFSIYIKADKPILIVAAVREVIVSSNQSVRDFICFMPTPSYNTACQISDLTDHHITDISTSRSFILTPQFYSTEKPCQAINVNIEGSNQINQQMVLNSSELQVASYYNGNNLGPNVDISVSNTFIQVSRLGFYNPNEENREGAFLDIVPSWNQFVTGFTAFAAVNPMDQITIIADYETMKFGELTMSGADYSGLLWVPLPYQGLNAYYFTTGIGSTEYCTFFSMGYYLIQITGSREGHAYGYTPRFSKEKLRQSKSTTTSSTTTSTTTSTISKKTTTSASTGSDITSVATSFSFVIPWGNGDFDSTSVFSIDILYQSDKADYATVTIEYGEFDGDKWKYDILRKSMTIIAHSSKDNYVMFNSSSAYPFVTAGLNKYPDLRIFVTSNKPVQVLVSSYAEGGSGDTFAAVPTSMAGTQYALSFPSSSEDGLSMVHFIPTLDHTEINFDVLTDTSRKHFTTTIGNGELMMFGMPNKPFTLYADSDKPFLIVAGVREIDFSSKSEQRDFMSFMPTPSYSKDCTVPHTQDVHLSDLSTSRSFIITPQYSVNNHYCSPVEIEQQGSNGMHESYTMNMSSYQLAHTINGTDFGPNIDISTKNALIQVVRLGYYNPKGINKQGAFMDLVPSWNQFYSGYTGFVTHNSMDQITVIGDNLTTLTALFYMPLKTYYVRTWIPLSYSGLNAYYFTEGIGTAGYYGFYAAGYYILQVTGSSGGHAYGYTPTFRQERLDHKTTTARPSSTITATTSITTTETSQKPTTTTTTSETTNVTTTTTSETTNVTTTTTSETTNITTTNTSEITSTTTNETSTTTASVVSSTSTGSVSIGTETVTSTTPSQKTSTSQPTTTKGTNSKISPIVIVSFNALLYILLH